METVHFVWVWMAAGSIDIYSPCHSRRILIVCLYIFAFLLLIRSLVDPTSAAFMVCSPLQFLVSQYGNSYFDQ